MPLEAPATDLALQVNISNPNRRTIMAMVTTLDTGVGSVVDALKATQMFPNSIIVLTTDKCGATLPLYMCPGCVVKIGAPLGPSGGATNSGRFLDAGNNWPLRGSKCTEWEGGVKGVAMVSSPLLSSSAVGTSWNG